MNKIVIEPELLESLYWGNGYPAWQIGNILGYSEGTVLRRMKEYDIPRCRMPRLAEDFVFTDRQKQVFEGCMLGDGGLVWQVNNCYFNNSDVHKKYLIWLQYKLGIGEISSIKPVYREGFCYEHHLVTRVIPSLQEEYKRWYPDGAGTRDDIHRKIIPKDIVLTLIKVLFWYLGDGHYRKDREAVRFNNSLVFDDWKVLLKKMYNVFDVDSGISIVKHGKDIRGSQIYMLCLNKVTTCKFFDMVDSLGFNIPECYQYKFGK